MKAVPVARPVWTTARGSLRFDRPIIAGILNLTPDSFWDGGRHPTGGANLRAALLAHPTFSAM